MNPHGIYVCGADSTGSDRYVRAFVPEVIKFVIKLTVVMTAVWVGASGVHRYYH